MGVAAQPPAAPPPAAVMPSVAEPGSEPPPRGAATGFFAEGARGAVTYLPHTSKDANTGPELSLRIGRDVFSWFSLGLYAAASSHEATLPPPPTGPRFQLYRGGADGRLGGRIGAIAVFVEGGAGIAMISSNVLEKAMVADTGEKYSITFHGGAGLEYQLENRHYAVGIGVVGFFVL